MLCSTLTENKRRQQTQRHMGTLLYDRDNQEINLERIKHNGSKTRPPTQKQLDSGRKIGAACNATCFICRKFLNADGMTVYRQTTWCCSICKMPICKEDRSNENGRSTTCLEEHFLQEEECLMCDNYVKGMPFPVKDQVNLNKRRTKRHKRS